MTESIKNIPLVNNQDENQFEVTLNGDVAFIEYVLRDNKIHLTHTEVPESLQGKGIASALVEKTLHHIKNEQLVLIPSCSFVAHYINNHPEWHSLLSEGYQM